MNIKDIDFAAIQSKIEKLDTEKRKIHSDRKIEDETKAMAAIREAGNLYKCRLEPMFDTSGNFMMQVETDEPDSEQTRKNMNDFGKYVNDVLTEYRVAFKPVAIVNDGVPAIKVYLLVTW